MTTRSSLSIEGPRPLRGRVTLPGDKGLSHRALLFAALGDGLSCIGHLAPGDDVARTRGALAALGVPIATRGDTLEVEGRGIDALEPPPAEIDCGNSGTTLRMLTGLVAGRPFSSTLTGDESLLRRPMARVVEPLRALGARITGRDGGALAPLSIDGTGLTGTHVDLPVASGQVQTAVVLAGLQASGTTEIVEPAISRDHTARMLMALGAPLERIDDATLRVHAGAPAPFTADLPGDPSSAAFLVVAAAITPGSALELEDVLLNPGRIEFVDALRRMGADIDVISRGERLGEPVGDIVVRAATLHGTVVDCHEPMIDEIPVLAVAAAHAGGETVFRGAAELRVKESDRFATVTELVAAIGGGAEAHADDLVVHGGTPHAVEVDSHGDHRIALAAAVAANAASGTSTITGWSASDASYPGFAETLGELTGAGSQAR